LTSSRFRDWAFDNFKIAFGSGNLDSFHGSGHGEVLYKSVVNSDKHVANSKRV
jgi:hypothetical protein